MTDQTPGPGHNLPPIEEIRQRTDDLIAATDQWLEKVPEIGDDDTAGKASDLLAQLRAEFKAVEEQRKAEKKPHTDAATCVDGEYNPLKVRLERSVDVIKAKLSPWLAKKQAAEDEARRQREEDAAKAQEEADRIAAEAETANSIDAQIEAEEAQKRAEAAAKASRKQTSANVKGQFGRTTTLRTTYRGEITDHNKALAVYAHDPLIVDALQTAINRDVRAGKRDIPGVEVKQDRKAA